MQQTTFYTHTEAAAIAGMAPGTLRGLVHRGVIRPKTQASWTVGELLGLAIFADLVAEQLDYGEAAGLAGAILKAAVTGKPPGGKAQSVFAIEMVDAAGQRTLRVAYTKADADKLARALLRRNPVVLKVRDFSGTFTRCRQALAEGSVDVGGYAAMQDREGAGHA